jgi:two-component system response regulator VanR
MLTGKLEISDKEEAFGRGADDYLTKPFSFKELAMRVKALLRRPAAVQGSSITAGPISMDLEKKLVTIGGERLELKPAEFSLLELFVKSPGRVFLSGELLAKLYHSESEATDEAIRQRIFRLRKLLGAYNCVKSVPGGGYRLEV